MDEQTDGELVANAQAGDADAFCLLIERYHILACAIAFRLVTHSEVVREVIQEATLQAYLSLGHLRDAAHFKSWFYGIVLNVCRNWLREQKTGMISLETLYDEWHDFSPPSSQVLPDPSEVVEEWELRQLVYEAVQNLSPKNIAVTQLFYYEQLSIQEIASRLGISLTAVRNRLHKGRNELRRRLMITYPDMEQRRYVPQVTRGKRRRETMIQVSVKQIVQQSRQTVVALTDGKGQRVLPLWLKEKEGYLLVEQFHASAQQKEYSSDPVSTWFDFMDQLLDGIRDTIEEVRIESLRDNLLYTVVRLHIGTKLHEIKARIGMGLGLAMRVRCPTYMPEEIFNRLAISLPVEGETQEQKIALLVQTLSKRVPASSLVTQTADLQKRPQNLDFSEGIRNWHFHGSGMAADNKKIIEAFDCAIDQGLTYGGHVSVSIKAKEGSVSAKGSLRQEFLADDYRGKQVRLSAFLKTRDFGTEFGYAGLWLTVEGLNETLLRIDSQEQPVQKTQDWTHRELMVDVPAEGISIEIGLFIAVAEQGQLWLSDVQFEVVSKNTPTPAE